MEEQTMNAINEWAIIVVVFLLAIGLSIWIDKIW